MRKHKFWMLWKTPMSLLVGLAGVGFATTVALGLPTCEAPCEEPATTSGTQPFTVTFLGLKWDGNHVTFTYEVCKPETPETTQKDLSHFVVSLDQLGECVPEDAEICNLLVSAKFDDESVDALCGTDPTTGVFGVKINTPEGYGSGCHVYEFTLDASQLKEGFTICADGCVLVATKAGNQDVRTDKNGQLPQDGLPGYACVPGPVCCQVTACTLSQGYWKNHPENWPSDVLENGLTLGTVNYTQAQLLRILDQPVEGNGLISLAHQLIAAKLNVNNGASCQVADNAIALADALIGNLVVPPVGKDSLAPRETSDLTAKLELFNTGNLTGCPGHCEDEQPLPPQP